jgi:prevent-host-death family protein
VRIVGVKELKARLSSVLREVQRGETYLVTQRDAVIARLGPPVLEVAAGVPDDVTSRLVRLGARPPTRPKKRGPLRRSGQGSGLTTAQIDELLAWARDESR